MKEHSYFMKLEVPVYVFRFPSVILGSRVRILEKIGKNHWILRLEKNKQFQTLPERWICTKSTNLVSVKLLTDSWQPSDIKEVEIVQRLFLVNYYYLLHVLFSYAQSASSVGGLVIHCSAGELAWQYIVVTRNNLCIISISLHDIFLVDS